MRPVRNERHCEPGEMLTLCARCSRDSQAGERGGPNQDHVAIVSDATMDGSTLLIVADGLGGYDRGDVASRMVCEELPELYYARLTEDSCRKSLHQAVTALNSRLYDSSQGAEPSTRMCTTVAAAAIQGRSAEIIHVGDSKAFLFRAGKLLYQSEDHCVRLRDFERESGASQSPRYLTQAIGARASVQPAQISMSLEEGDVLLLCSDGVSDVCSPEEMISLIAAEESFDAEQLVKLAQKKGAIDDVSCVIARISSLEPTTQDSPATHK